MKQTKIIIIVLLITLFLTACGSEEAATPTPEPIAAAPEPTDVPPTETTTAVPPTDTPEPTNTPEPTETAIPTNTPSPTPTATPIPPEIPGDWVLYIDPDCNGQIEGTLFFTFAEDGTITLTRPTYDDSPRTGTWETTATELIWTNSDFVSFGEPVSVYARNGTELYKNTTEDDGSLLCISGHKREANSTLNNGRYRHTVTTLPDGSILLIGGLTGGRDDFAKAVGTIERYDPATGLWELVGNLNTPRWNHTATLLEDGRVLIAGGRSAYHIWDHVEGLGRPEGVGLPDGPDGEVVAGRTTQRTADNTLRSAEIFDPATGAITSAGNMGRKLFNHAATLLDDGRLLVSGGESTSEYSNIDKPITTDYVTIFDPTTNGWTAVSPMNEIRASHTSTLLPDGRIMVTGGNADTEGGNGSRKGAELYDLATDSWTPTEPMAAAMQDHTAILLEDGRVFIIGGFGKNDVRKVIDIYNPSTESWQTIADKTEEDGHKQMTATLLPDGRVLIVGGNRDESIPSTHVELFDPADNSLTTVASLNLQHTNHTASLLPDGTVLILGGQIYLTTDGLLSQEQYDPLADIWTLYP